MSKRTSLPRIERDLYTTWDPKAVTPMIPLWNTPDVRFIEPCCGSGDLIANIETKCDAECVYASDIQPLPRSNDVRSKLDLPFYHHGIFKAVHTLDDGSVVDEHEIFSDEKHWRNVADHHGATHFITNPPWLNTKASDYQLLRIIELLSKVRPTWLLLNANFAFNLRSSDVMEFCSDIYCVGRLKWIPNSPHSATEDSCWFLFDQEKASNNNGPTIHPRSKSYAS